MGWSLSNDINDNLQITQDYVSGTNYYGSDQEAAERVFILYSTFIRANTTLAKLYGKPFIKLTRNDYEGIGWTKNTLNVKSLCDKTNNELTERVCELASKAYDVLHTLTFAIEDTLISGQKVEQSLLDFITDHNGFVNYDNSHNNLPESTELQQGMDEEPTLCDNCQSTRTYIGLTSYNNKQLSYCKICDNCEE